MKQPIFLYSVLCLMLFVSCKQSLKDEAKVVSPEEMQTLLEMDSVQLVDVRTPEEYEVGFIANAQNINYFSPTFSEDIKNLDKEKPVILYCRSGRRSAKCSEKLIKAGFIKVYDLDGGITKWIHEGLEVNTQQ